MVEPQYILSYSPFLTDCASDFTDNSFLTSSKEGGVTDFNDSIDSVVATDSNSDYNAAFAIDPNSSSENQLRSFQLWLNHSVSEML